jgi:hypothetical protein
MSTPDTLPAVADLALSNQLRKIVALAIAEAQLEKDVSGTHTKATSLAAFLTAASAVVDDIIS